jgi:hypothetical protein
MKKNKKKQEEWEEKNNNKNEFPNPLSENDIATKKRNASFVAEVIKDLL